MEIPKKSSKTHQKIDTTRVGPVFSTFLHDFLHYVVKRHKSNFNIFSEKICIYINEAIYAA
jgi:hypothetical protein